VIWVLDTIRMVDALIALASIPAAIWAAFLRPRPWDERMVLLGLVGYSVLLAGAYLQGLGTSGSDGIWWRLPLLAVVTSVSTTGMLIYSVREWHRMRDGQNGKT
jgi:hypothetical protein